MWQIPVTFRFPTIVLDGEVVKFIKPQRVKGSTNKANCVASNTEPCETLESAVLIGIFILTSSQFDPQNGSSTSTVVLAQVLL